MFKSYKQNLLHIHPGFDKTLTPRTCLCFFFQLRCSTTNIQLSDGGPGAMSSARQVAKAIPGRSLGHNRNDPIVDGTSP